MWIPLIVYATKKGVSLSTLRRYIKSNKIQYKVEDGRYLLFDDSATENESFATVSAPVAVPATADDRIYLQSKLQKLEFDLRKAQEEIAELKMLVALYEEQMSPLRLDS